MKVLIINIDKNIFELKSPSLERLKEYSNFCEKFSVVVLTQKYFGPIIFGNLDVFATASCCRAKYSFDALKLAKKIMKKEKYDLVVTQDPFDTGHIGWLIKRKYKISWQYNYSPSGKYFSTGIPNVSPYSSIIADNSASDFRPKFRNLSSSDSSRRTRSAIVRIFAARRQL